MKIVRVEASYGWDVDDVDHLPLWVSSWQRVCLGPSDIPVFTLTSWDRNALKLCEEDAVALALFVLDHKTLAGGTVTISFVEDAP